MRSGLSQFIKKHFDPVLAILVHSTYRQFSNFSLCFSFNTLRPLLFHSTSPSSSVLCRAGRRRGRMAKLPNRPHCSSLSLPNHSYRNNGVIPSLFPVSISDHSCDVNKGLSVCFPSPSRDDPHRLLMFLNSSLISTLNPPEISPSPNGFFEISFCTSTLSITISVNSPPHFSRLNDSSRMLHMIPTRKATIWHINASSLLFPPKLST